MHSFPPTSLYITSFLDLLATSLLVPFLAIHLRSMGLSQLLVGMVISVYPTVQIFASPAVGYCSKCFGHKHTLFFSLLVCASAYCLLGSTTSIVPVFICRVALGVLKHTQTLCKSIFAEFSNNDRLAKAFGMISAAEALGFMLGPIVGAHFIEMHNGFQILCKITTTLFLTNALMVYCVLPDRKSNLTSRTAQKEISNVSNNCQNFSGVKWSVFWDILVLKWLLCVSLSLFYTNFAFVIVEQLEVSASVIGYINSFQGFISIVTGLFTSKLSDRFYPKESQYQKLFHCYLVLSFSLLCICFVSNLFTFVVCLIPLCASSSMLRIYTTEVLIRKSTLENRGYLISVENTIASFAFLSSPFIFEICSTTFGAHSVSFMIFLLTATGSGLILFLNLSTYPKQNLSYDLFK